MRLYDLSKGRAKILKADGNLERIGIYDGANIKVFLHSPLHGPTIIETEDGLFAIRRNLLKKIIIRKSEE